MVKSLESIRRKVGMANTLNELLNFSREGLAVVNNRALLEYPLSGYVQTLSSEIKRFEVAGDLSNKLDIHFSLSLIELAIGKCQISEINAL